MVDPLQRATLIDRDNNGNAIQVTRPNGALTTFAYDIADNLQTRTDEGIGAHVQYKYEPQFNQVIEHTDANGEPVSTTTFTRMGSEVLSI